MVGAAVAGATIVAGVASSAMSSSASGKAAKMQNQAANSALGEQARQFNVARQDQLPFLQTGQAGNAQLGYLLGLSSQNPANYNTSGQMPDGSQNFLMGEDGQLSPDINQNLGGYGSLLKPFGMEDYQEDPGYQFRLTEGQKALNRAYGSKGKYFSGEAIKGLEGYNQNMASQEYQNAYNRYVTNQTNTYNRLAGISGTGQTSANTLGNLGSNYASNVGNIAMNNANAQGAAGIAQANAWGTGLNNAAGNLAYYYGNKYNSPNSSQWLNPDTGQYQ